MAEPHLGASMIVAVIALSMLFFAGTPLIHLFGLATIGAAGAGLVVRISKWRWERFVGYLDPWADPLGNGYQSLQSLHAIASGGLTGVGLGASRAKWGFLPYAHTDFIFAVIAEELGLLGALSVIALFITIGVAGLLVGATSS